MGSEESTVAFSSSKDKIVIDVAYCGGCGWSLLAKKLTDALKKKIPSCLIDCRPENEYTGVVKISFVLGKDSKEVYKGNKE